MDENKRYGFLQVINEEVVDKLKYWNCLCDCGTHKKILANNVKRGVVVSCGCYGKQRRREAKTKHGKRHHPVYICWKNIHARCNNPRNTSYDNYGGRGIRVCDKWRSPDAFLADMLPTYFEGATIERLDVDGDYCPENCCWIVLEKQARNKTMLRSNTSGYTGVVWNTDGKRTRAIAQWREGGKLRSKSFAVVKYGLLPAFLLACDYRDAMIAKLNTKGAGYSDKHGK